MLASSSDLPRAREMVARTHLSFYTIHTPRCYIQRKEGGGEAHRDQAERDLSYRPRPSL